MKPERLQEIKEVNRTRAGNLWGTNVIKELIAAIEAAQAELAEANKSIDNLYAVNANINETMIDLRKQLSASEAAEEISFVANELLREQLADASKINKLSEDCMVDQLDKITVLVAELAASQAEVERLRGEKVYTADELKDKYFPNVSWEKLGRVPIKSIFDKEV